MHRRPSRSHEGKEKVRPDLEEMGIPKEVPVNKEIISQIKHILIR